MPERQKDRDTARKTKQDRQSERARETERHIQLRCLPGVCGHQSDGKIATHTCTSTTHTDTHTHAHARTHASTHTHIRISTSRGFCRRCLTSLSDTLPLHLPTHPYPHTHAFFRMRKVGEGNQANATLRRRQGQEAGGGMDKSAVAVVTGGHAERFERMQVKLKEKEKVIERVRV